jgi:hypothetical protein
MIYCITSAEEDASKASLRSQAVISLAALVAAA